jgi:uncharacterized protein YndB with AHSA1/START domain
VDAKKSSDAKLLLPSDREIVIVRAFQARKDSVFEAWSKPEHVRRWYVCSTMTMPVCEIDFRAGGKWRWVQRDPASGTDHPISGEYREITRADRLVFTERYEPVPQSEHLVTLTFEERNGVTTLTHHILHASKENRDGHLQSGMDRGLPDLFARLDAVLDSMAAPAPEGDHPSTLAARDERA